MGRNTGFACRESGRAKPRFLGPIVPGWHRGQIKTCNQNICCGIGKGLERPNGYIFFIFTRPGCHRSALFNAAAEARLAPCVSAPPATPIPVPCRKKLYLVNIWCDKKCTVPVPGAVRWWPKLQKYRACKVTPKTGPRKLVRFSSTGLPCRCLVPARRS